ncbi:MAG TPA: ATPase domain-containing protein [Candidatus Norongarragalinales archaeon]|nr:ATPase domain-containing protein [Candidatus Norongarragalinales archaeon]
MTIVMDHTFERLKTGIKGLDDLVEGGFPKGRTILVSGATGTGKSIFGMQFIYKGAVDYGEPGVFVTFDENPDKMREDLLRFGWDIHEEEKKDKVAIIDGSSARAGSPSEEEHLLMPGLDFNKLLVDMIGVCKKLGAKRLVVDSIPAIGQLLEREGDIRRNLLKLSYVLGKTGVTTIITSEIEEQDMKQGPTKFSKYGVEEYVADGVILLNMLSIGSTENRTAYIRKMRGTKHSLAIHPLQINEHGLNIKKAEDIFK